MLKHTLAILIATTVPAMAAWVAPSLTRRDSSRGSWIVERANASPGQ